MLQAGTTLKKVVFLSKGRITKLSQWVVPFKRESLVSEWMFSESQPLLLYKRHFGDKQVSESFACHDSGTQENKLNNLYIQKFEKYPAMRFFGQSRDLSQPSLINLVDTLRKLFDTWRGHIFLESHHTHTHT